MPKVNDKVFCINHPDKEMDGPNKAVISNVNKDDNGAWKYTTGLYVYIHKCAICQYIEMYSMFEDS